MTIVQEASNSSSLQESDLSLGVSADDVPRFKDQIQLMAFKFLSPRSDESMFWKVEEASKFINKIQVQALEELYSEEHCVKDTSGNLIILEKGEISVDHIDVALGFFNIRQVISMSVGAQVKGLEGIEFIGSCKEYSLGE